MSKQRLFRGGAHNLQRLKFLGKLRQGYQDLSVYEDYDTGLCYTQDQATEGVRPIDCNKNRLYPVPSGDLLNRLRDRSDVSKFLAVVLNKKLKLAWKKKAVYDIGVARGYDSARMRSLGDTSITIDELSDKYDIFFDAYFRGLRYGKQLWYSSLQHERPLLNVSLPTNETHLLNSIFGPNS